MEEQATQKEPLERLLWIMERLRSPEGCPWDHKQNHQTLKSNLVEETYEVIDAIESGSPEKLREELGDLLLQVVFHSQISQEESEFDFQDVARGIGDKLIRRHPHVFGNSTVEDSDGVIRNWDRIKKSEKPNRSIIGDVPRHLPALQKAHRVQSRAARTGFDWPEIKGVLEKIDEELEEVKEALAQKDTSAIQDEIGDLLFSTVNLSRFLGHNPEEVLNANIRKFIQRFRLVEKLVDDSNQRMDDYSIEGLEALWQESKETLEKLNQKSHLEPDSSDSGSQE